MLNFVEVLEWVNMTNFIHASSFRCCWSGKAIYCDMWLLVCAGSGLYICLWHVGGRRTVWFLGCRAALASWLLDLLLSFDYQNPCLLFLKIQVQDQNDYVANCLRLIFKIHPICVLGIYAWLFGFVKPSFIRILIFVWGFQQHPNNQYYYAFECTLFFC
jgi:hypothetical protein